MEWGWAKTVIWAFGVGGKTRFVGWQGVVAAQVRLSWSDDKALLAGKQGLVERKVSLS